MPKRLKVLIFIDQSNFLFIYNFFRIALQMFFFNFSELTKPKVRRIPTETLKGIQEVYKRTEEEKRRLELESQLYKRWRPASREENILLSSRSNNEALAKMNWLDKQVLSLLNANY